MTQKSAIEKIWESHRIAPLGESNDLLLIDRILLHERTGGVAMQSLEDSGRVIRHPSHVFVTMDHVVDTIPGRSDTTQMPTGKDFITVTRDTALRAGVTLFDLGDPRQGIGHVISPEMAIVLPGATLVCPDSHTCTQGAFGALAWGIGSSEGEHALATSTLRVQRPRIMRITIEGEPGVGVTAKDIALHIVSELSSAGAKGFAIEYAGPVIRAMSMESRMTLCNMATELSAFTAFIAPDETTFEFLKDRAYAPKGEEWVRAVNEWRKIKSDPEAIYDEDIVINATDIAPTISWGTSPQQSCPINKRIPLFNEVSHRDTQESYQRALTYMGLTPGGRLSGLRIDAAFIGSCTNSRLPDLRRAAAILKGRRVAKGVNAICVPGSSAVKAAAEAEGLDLIFKAAGFEWRESGCSMCFFAGGESFGPKQRVVSSTNRNFESRQGPQTRTHIASPETVAASAISGCITDPRRLGART
ncbi:MAG: 3-isopropylmalate dehydratase [Hirschia sp.]|nr:3-isopropylmalate dehydratase [Hirschia sp.]MBF19952.1 3-isopropylmalate dehydratase [Hirschia sp.]